MKNIIATTIILLTVALAGCDEHEIKSGETGSLTIEFDTKAGDENLEFNKAYTNASGETFTVTKFKYYISNIRLKKTDGGAYTVPQDSSYFLITEDDAKSQKVRINNIPAGDYNEITFTIGVDSLRNTMALSKRTGVLDPSQTDMYWTWNSGYIFFKFEGTSPSAPDNKFYYHIGGFGGYDAPAINNIKETTISMGSARAEVRSNKSPQVHLHVDVLEVFKNPETVSIAAHPTVMHGDYSVTVAGNYVNMFRYDHVHN